MREKPRSGHSPVRRPAYPADLPKCRCNLAGGGSQVNLSVSSDTPQQVDLQVLMAGNPPVVQASGQSDATVSLAASFVVAQEGSCVLQACLSVAGGRLRPVCTSRLITWVRRPLSCLRAFTRCCRGGRRRFPWRTTGKSLGRRLQSGRIAPNCDQRASPSNGEGGESRFRSPAMSLNCRWIATGPIGKNREYADRLAGPAIVVRFGSVQSSHFVIATRMFLEKGRNTQCSRL
jgi:hypothetical protein